MSELSDSMHLLEAHYLMEPSLVRVIYLANRLPIQLSGNTLRCQPIC